MLRLSHSTLALTLIGAMITSLKTPMAYFFGGILLGVSIGIGLGGLLGYKRENNMRRQIMKDPGMPGTLMERQNPGKYAERKGGVICQSN